MLRALHSLLLLLVLLMLLLLLLYYLQYGLGDLTDGGPATKGKYNGGQEPYNVAW